MRNSQIDVQPIAGSMGAELYGVDLSEELDDGTFGEVHQALLDHGAIFFRDQVITPTQQMAFAKRWGKVHLHPHMPCLPNHPGIIEIVKKEDDTVAFGGNWHTDQMFTDTPARVHHALRQAGPARRRRHHVSPICTRPTTRCRTA